MLLEIESGHLHSDIHGEGEPLVWLHGGMAITIGNSSSRPCQWLPPDRPDLRGHGARPALGPSTRFNSRRSYIMALLDRLQLERSR